MIDMTLPVQLLNFLIAYFVLHYFFFTPINALIQNEESALKKQHVALQDQKNKIAEHLNLKRDEWRACQGYFKEHSPQPIAHRGAEPSQHKIELSNISSDELATLRKEVQNFIISKVNHVS